MQDISGHPLSKTALSAAYYTPFVLSGRAKENKPGAAFDRRKACPAGNVPAGGAFSAANAAPGLFSFALPIRLTHVFINKNIYMYKQHGYGKTKLETNYERMFFSWAITKTRIRKIIRTRISRRITVLIRRTVLTRTTKTSVILVDRDGARQIISRAPLFFITHPANAGIKN